MQHDSNNSESIRIQDKNILRTTAQGKHCSWRGKNNNKQTKNSATATKTFDLKKN